MATSATLPARVYTITVRNRLDPNEVGNRVARPTEQQPQRVLIVIYCLIIRPFADARFCYTVMNICPLRNRKRIRFV